MMIDESRFITIGGLEQFIMIAGEDIKNPLLLLLHGGNSETAHFSYYNAPLEKYFTLVYWDQRGVAKSYDKAHKDARPLLDDFIEDTHELTLYLKKRFNKEKIYLLGHSWGSMLGIKTVQKYPEDYEAYIAISQMSDPLKSDALMLEYLAKFSSIMIEPLTKESIESTNLVKRSNQLLPLGVKYGGLLYERSLWKVLKMSLLPILRFSKYSIMDKYHATQLNENRLKIYYKHKIEDEVKEIKTAIYFFHGSADYVINYHESKAYHDSLVAPQKKFFTFEKSAHMPTFEEPDLFHTIMIEEVLGQK